MSRRRRAVGFVFVLSVSAMASFATAEVVSPLKPTTVVVGTSRGPMTMSKLDPERRGVTSFSLPHTALKVVFRKPLATAFDQPVLVKENGEIVAVSSRGDVYTLTPDGEEKARLIRGGIGVSPAALLADGTVVFVTSRGEAVGVRNNVPTFEVRLVSGATTTPRAAPVPLVDGGVVVAAGNDLVLLDSRGKINARTTLAEPASLPLLFSNGEVIAVGSSGAVFSWTLGGESRRIGAFSGSVQGSVAKTATGHFVGVLTTGSHIAALDPVSGSSLARVVPDKGIFVGHVSTYRDRLFVLSTSSNALFGVSYASTGEELSRTRFATLPATDGGAVSSLYPGPLVDQGGAWAFATQDGTVGTASAEPGGGVDTVGEKVCPVELRGAVAGLSPSTERTFLVTCRNGTIVKIGGLSRVDPE